MKWRKWQGKNWLRAQPGEYVKGINGKWLKK
jgi:uncharacterized protein YdbL (DUF1318 family)